MAALDNEKHERFCQEYIKDMNGKKAYVRTYPDSSEKAAESASSRLLRNVKVQQRISELQTKVSDRIGIDQDMILQEIAKVAFANIGYVCEWDANGSLTLKEKSEMGIGLGAIQSIQSTDIFDKDGNKIQTKNKFNMHDKLKALELLSRHLGILDGSGGKGKTGEAIAARLREVIGRVRGAGAGTSK